MPDHDDASARVRHGDDVAGAGAGAGTLPPVPATGGGNVPGRPLDRTPPTEPPREPPTGAAPARGAGGPAAAADPDGGLVTAAGRGPLALVSLAPTGSSAAAVRRMPDAWHPGGGLGATDRRGAVPTGRRPPARCPDRPGVVDLASHRREPTDAGPIRAAARQR